MSSRKPNAQAKQERVNEILREREFEGELITYNDID